ncbi:MAG: alpha/beta hydrolase [Candidatus Cloacimonetes bacterium]|nr:alpha/beta hydrolase [Candidatus Cloacimonadota bacterium]
MTHIQQSMLRITLTLLVLVPVIFIAIVYFLQDLLLFHKIPSEPGIIRYNLNHYPNSEKTLTTPDGVKLHGWFVQDPSPKKHPLVFYFGGNASNVEFIVADKKYIPGISACTFNYRGYGLSEGKPSEKKIVEDALLIYNSYKDNPNIDQNNIVIMGRSLGTGVAIQLAAKVDAAKLILVSPYDSMINTAYDHYPFLPIQMMLKNPFKSEDFIDKVKQKTLIIYGDQDQVVRPERTLALIKKFKVKPKVEVFQGRVHNDVFSDPNYWPVINDFILGE